MSFVGQKRGAGENGDFGSASGRKVSKIEPTSEVSSSSFSHSKICSCEKVSKKIEDIQDKLAGINGRLTGLEMLNSKVDRLIRLMSDQVEAQAKTNRLIQVLSRESSGSKKVKKPPVVNSVALCLKSLKEPEADLQEPQRSVHAQKPQRSAEVDLNWASNTLLVGDALWLSLTSGQVPDVTAEVLKLEAEVKFKVSCIKKDDLKVMLDDLYDLERDKILFALPPKVKKVVVSIGSADLFNPALLTLSQASLETLKAKNRPWLQAKADQLKAMVQKLIGLGKQVVYVVPFHRFPRREIFKHWQQILEETLDGGDLKVISLPDLMASTEHEAKSKQDHVKMWFEDPKAASLTPYATRRLFDSVKKTLMNQRLFTAPVCPRCTRVHAGGPDKCKSKDKTCRQCGKVGHFVEVHDVTDPEFRRRIVDTIGIDIFGQGLETPAAAPIKLLDDWYH